LELHCRKSNSITIPANEIAFSICDAKRNSIASSPNRAESIMLTGNPSGAIAAWAFSALAPSKPLYDAAIHGALPGGGD
jgi:hypothetical protein